MSVSVVMPVHNQEGIIERVMQGLVNSVSGDVREIIIILDGCMDGTRENINNFVYFRVRDWGARPLKIRLFSSDNIFEVRACNAGFKLATGDYILTLQDDMVLNEPEIDRRLMQPFKAVPNLLGVTARNAQDDILVDGRVVVTNVFGRDAQSPRDVFGIRDVIVRGPILFDHARLESLGYLDESFTPLSWDDHDLSYRAYRAGLLVGAYACDYESRREWGSTRRLASGRVAFREANGRNEQLLITRHRDLLTGDKHDRDISLPVVV